MSRKNFFSKRITKSAGEAPADLKEEIAAEPAEKVNGGEPPAKPTLPLFYVNPQPLQTQRHGAFGLSKKANHRFAAAAHAVVLHAQEFRQAAMNFPIVFSNDDEAQPLALLGFREGQNLFVDEGGNWKAGCYIPSYIRRYPFLTVQPQEGADAILYVDESSDHIVNLDLENEADPLFVEGQPSEKTKEIVDFCAAFQQQTPITKAFVDAVRTHDLLAPKEIRYKLPDGSVQTVSGFRVIEEERFGKLSDNDFLEWRHKGWLSLVYWHWASMDNFLRFLQQ